MGEVQVSLSALVPLIQTRMVFCVTLSVNRVTKELVQCVGSSVHQVLEMMELFVPNLLLMAEELVMLSGTKESVRDSTLKDVRKMVYCGIPSVDLDTSLVVVAFVHQYVKMDKQTSESLVPRNLKEEELESQ